MNRYFIMAWSGSHVSGKTFNASLSAQLNTFPVFHEVLEYLKESLNRSSPDDPLHYISLDLMQEVKKEDAEIWFQKGKDGFGHSYTYTD